MDTVTRITSRVFMPWNQQSSRETVNLLTMPTNSPLTVTELSKSYNSKKVLQNLNFQLPAGEITTILGANGTGKTTLIECCEGLRKPDQGEIRIFNTPISKLTNAHKAKIGVMLQNGGLPTAVSAKTLLSHFRSLYTDAYDITYLNEALELSTYWQTKVRNLSIGQRQKVALSLAIVGKPKLLFLDEPTAGADPQTQRSIWALINTLKSQGTTILLSTHNLKEAEENSDYVAFLTQGKISEFGPVREVLKANSKNVVTVRPLPNQHSQTLALIQSLLAAPENHLNWQITDSALGRITLCGDISIQGAAQLLNHLAKNDHMISGIDLNKNSLEEKFFELIEKDHRAN